ncbi:hypothetical protein KXW38_001983, partial [Aspergillus fumigatus]
MKTLPDDLMAVSVGWKDHIDGEKSLPSGPSKEALTGLSFQAIFRRLQPQRVQIIAPPLVHGDAFLPVLPPV